MSAFPNVILDAEYVAQQPYASNTVKIIQLDDNVDSQSLRVFVQLGDNNSFKYWIPVLSGEEYTVDWTNELIVNKVKEFFVNA
jgi:hypothetical protein